MDDPRNASAAVIGAGDFIGAAIARRFAAGGYAVFAGRRNGEKLAPLVAEIEADRRPVRRPHARRPQGGGGHRVPGRGRARRAARGLRLQRRRQRQLPHPGDHGARVPQGVGDGLLRGLPRRPRGGAPDAAARPRLDLLHRRHRQPARRPGLRRLRQREVRPAGGGAEHGARARPAEHPRRPPRDRLRRRHGVGARAAARAPRQGAARARTRRADATRPPSPRPTGSCTCSRATPGPTSWTCGPMGRRGEMDEIEFHFDFGSPNAYLAHRVRPGDRAAHRRAVPLRAGPARRRLQGDRQPLAGGGLRGTSRASARSRAARNAALPRAARHHRLPPQPALPGEHARRHARCRRGPASRDASSATSMSSSATCGAEPKKMDEPEVVRAVLEETGFDAERLLARAQDPRREAGADRVTRRRRSRAAPSARPPSSSATRSSSARTGCATSRRSSSGAAPDHACSGRSTVSPARVKGPARSDGTAPHPTLSTPRPVLEVRRQPDEGPKEGQIDQAAITSGEVL